MNAVDLFGPLSDTVLLLALSVTRIAVAFLLVPLFTAELIPALVRNAMFMSIALLGLLMQPAAAPFVPATLPTLVMFGKEAFIGCTIGFFFSGVMWAFQTAGQLIDTKAGTSQAQVTDPMTGQQVTLNGALLGRLASWIFMAGGGFMLMIGTILESFTLWPVRSLMPSLAPDGMKLFESEFGRIMLLTLLVAAPALVMLHVVEGILGLVNRFAQQLNVFSLSQSIKTVTAVWIIWVQITVLIQFMQDDLLTRGGLVLQTLRALFRS